MSDILSFASSEAFDGDDQDDGGNSKQEESLEMDDNLGPLQRFKRYLQASLLLRLHVVREIVDICKSIGYEQSASEIVQYLPDLANDSESIIRQAFAERLYPLSSFFISEGGEKGYSELVIDLILPLISKLIVDQNSQVREAASEGLVNISKTLLNDKDLKSIILKMLKDLANDANDEEYRVEASILFHHLSENFGEEITSEYVTSTLSKLAEDPMFRVRKSVAANLTNIIKTIGKEKTTNLLVPIYVKMCGDEIWGVRKACSESLVGLSSSLLSNLHRSTLLIPLFTKLADDTSRWVRSAAYQNLGPFIATFEQQQPASTTNNNNNGTSTDKGTAAPYFDMKHDPGMKKLIELYIGMINDSNDSKYGDSDAITYAAFNFPAVLYTLTSKNWPMLSASYFSLTKELQWKVRRTLSHSLHVIAEILGREITENSLLNTFDLFLKDLDEVKIGVIKGFSHFIAVLSSTKRLNYLSTLQELTLNEAAIKNNKENNITTTSTTSSSILGPPVENSNWRFRKILAKQLGDLSKLYEYEAISKTIIPLTLNLVHDKVASVRRAANTAIGVLINSVTEEKARMELISQINQLRQGKSFGERQTYISISEKVLGVISNPLFEAHFLENMMSCCNDKVPNVRLSLSRSLAAVIPTNRWLLENKTVAETIQKLKTDKDRDARYYISTITTDNTTTPTPGGSSHSSKDTVTETANALNTLSLNNNSNNTTNTNTPGES